MSILQGLDPQAIEEVFGDVPNLPAGFDVEYLPVTRANVEHMAVIIQILQEDAAKMRAELGARAVCAQVKTCNGAAILELEKRIAELELERDAIGAALAAYGRTAVISGGTPTLTERAANKRIAELERERDVAITNTLTCLQMMEQAQSECEALRGDKNTFPIATHNGMHIYSDADAVERKIISLETDLSAAIADARNLANFIDYHCVEDMPDALTRETVTKYLQQ